MGRILGSSLGLPLGTILGSSLGLILDALGVIDGTELGTIDILSRNSYVKPQNTVTPGLVITHPTYRTQSRPTAKALQAESARQKLRHFSLSLVASRMVRTLS